MAMVGAMAAPAIAEDGVKSGFTGQAGFFFSNTVKDPDDGDKTNVTEVQTDAQVGGQVTVTKGKWVSEVKVQFDADGYGNNDNNLDLSDSYVSLSNGDITIKGGFFYVGGVTKGISDWGWTAIHTDTFKFGDDAGVANWSEYGGTNEDFGLFARNQNVKVSLDKIGIWASYAAWQGDAHNDAANDSDDYKALRAGYNGNFGMVDLSVQYTSFDIDTDEDRSSTASSNDGFEEREWSVGVGLKLSDKFDMGINFETTKIKYHEGADDTNLVTYGLAANYNLGDMGKVGGSYAFRNEETLKQTAGTAGKYSMGNDKSDDDAKTTMITLNWQKWINATNVFVHVLDKDVKDDPKNGDYKRREMGVGMLQFF